MDDEPKKRVDESWKEQAAQEKTVPKGAEASASPTLAGTQETVTGPEGLPEARFDLFISGLAMEALIALGEMPHPVTRQQGTNLGQAKYLIDLLGLLEQKTAKNLTVDEEKLLKDTLYQLRTRYLAKGGGTTSP